MSKAGGSTGLAAEPVQDNLFEWEVRFTGFDPGSEDANERALASDLQPLRRDPGAVVCRVIFPGTYPGLPPYVRVLRPRFHFRTGHVTLGGSVCTPELTNQGWDPSMTVEAILVSIRNNLIQGGARVDGRIGQDYTEAEAKEAFQRMIRTHVW